MPDHFALEVARALGIHVAAVGEQQQVLAAQGSEYGEAACRMNRGLHELEIAKKLLEVAGRQGVSP